jgi:hypothetical protein
MIWLAGFALGWVGLRTLVVLVNLLTRPWLNAGVPKELRSVSVLIPARNEADNIGHLLEGLAAQEHPIKEVLVYDDLSTDDTAGVVRRYMIKMPQLQLIQAEQEPPSGWLGKNHGCHRLALQATGDYLLFLDADVSVSITLIGDLVAQLQHRKLRLLSLFPVQQMETRGEWLLVPLMNRILLSLLPLSLTRLSRRPSLSAANGQCMLFDAGTYRAHQYHALFKDAAVEDITIFKRMKKQRYRVQTLLSNGQISCRMYHGWEEAMNGFSKNVLAFFGNRALPALGYALFGMLGWVPVCMALPWLATMVWLLFSICIVAGTSGLSQQNTRINLMLAVSQQLALFALIFRAMKARKAGTQQWKGRAIK